MQLAPISLTERQQAACDAAEATYVAAGIPHAGAILASAAVVRDPAHAHQLSTRFAELYTAGTGSVRTGAMFALAGMDREWSTAIVSGPVATAYKAALGSAVASATKAITSVDLGVPIAQIDAYRGQLTQMGVPGALLTDAGLRHHLPAATMEAASKAFGASQALAGVITLSAALDTGRDAAQLTSDAHRTAAELHVTETAGALIAAAAALTGSRLDDLQNDYAHMNAYFAGSDDDAATVFAAYVVGNSRGPLPLYLYSREPSDD